MRHRAILYGWVWAMLAACGSQGGAPPREASEGYIVAPDGEVSMAIDTGRHLATLRSGARVPISLPDGLTLFPGSEVTGSTIATHGDVGSSLVTFRSDAPVGAVAAHFREVARSAGFVAVLDLAAEGTHTLVAEREDGAAFTLTLARGEGGGSTGEISARRPLRLAPGG